VVNGSELMKNALEKRFTQLKIEQKEECIANAVLEADIYVDSVIYQMTRFSVLDDSLQMISKPKRPIRPEYLDISDPGPILPFELEK